jgi:hypothetical protein
MGYGSLNPDELRAGRRKEIRDKLLQPKAVKSRSGRTWIQEALPIVDTPWSPERLEACEKALEDVGEFRGLSVSLAPTGELKVTVKLTLPGGSRVYRHGNIEVLSDLPNLLLYWCSKGYWTPDKF